MGTMMSCATLSRRLMDRVHCRTDGLTVLSLTFFETLACVAALKAEIEKGMQRTKAIHMRGSICFYFTANGRGKPVNERQEARWRQLCNGWSTLRTAILRRLLPPRP